MDRSKKYSIIIPYRDREPHLKILLPVLTSKFEGYDYEIIISEQDDANNFRIACLENVGFNHCDGDVIVLHQVDYVPSDDVSYEVDDAPILPTRKAVFLNDDLGIRSFTDIPQGYRQGITSIDDDFYGGVICIPRNDFIKINGIHPGYVGWGNEDEDLRERFRWANIQCKRNNVGTFYVLNHSDNCPTAGDKDRYIDFVNGRLLLHNSFNQRHVGFNNLTYDHEMFYVNEVPNCKWIKSTNYKIN